MGLAVAFIMGVYLGALVQALVKDFIMPIIGWALLGAGIGNLSTLKFGIPLRLLMPLETRLIPTTLGNYLVWETSW